MRIAVCDDEKVCRDRIVGLIKPYKEKDPEITVNEFCCGEDLVAAYANGEQFDILFLDIQMKDIDGVETAHIIRETDKNTIIFFITSHVNFVSDTFRVGTFQFLVKPVEEADFILDFERAIESYKINHYKHLFKQKEGNCIIEIKEIFFIEVYNKHLYVNAENQVYECTGTLAEEEKKFKKYNFVMCHKSYLVNLRYIKLVGIDNIQLTNGKQIPLSKNFKTDVKAALNKYILECSV
ncbi:MAG: LytTR family DNA-binding domain-containing protein [Eubacteriales bacterium]